LHRPVPVLQLFVQQSASALHGPSAWEQHVPVDTLQATPLDSAHWPLPVQGWPGPLRHAPLVVQRSPSQHALYIPHEVAL
jgi:hypothetical protein